ncbi:restriction endonuclease subunit S [Acinetobacter bereziniae]|uniref:restriction endonuclease subunit S n=3 Tax=Acinetobacter bereziniae TaxID=106648 RepID=UPI00157FC9BE|nr:restriction endonuclease subunit S [Acinetobacter bereziniae]NUG07202.1 restriction endonuclease subunit S [Acinetobacter bereziniae]NUG68630.1 restriction endonuclease subunit S [Acinetobacter bereziniae]
MEKVQLGTLVKITSGFAFKSNLFNTDKKGLPLIRIRDVVRGYSDTYYDGEYKAEYLIQKGDALIGMDGEFNLALWNCGKALLNQRVCKIQSIDERLDQNYLIRFLPKALKDIEDRTPFVTVKHLSVKDINNIQIPLPPLEEQRRIASILDQADELRQKRQQAIEKLDQLLQATFIDMFGDPVSNPKGWDLVNLESLLAKKLISGAYFPKETYVNSGGVPMVHMGDVFYGVVKPDNLKQVNISNEEIKKYKITNKDILIARRSLTYDGAAKACLVECSNQDMIFESSLIRLSPNLVKILPEFLYHYLNNNDVRNKFIIPYITKSTISGINQANLNKVTVLLPPLAKQEKFIEICDKFKQFGKTLTHDLNKLDELFKSLQNQAFNGTL